MPSWTSSTRVSVARKRSPSSGLSGTGRSFMTGKISSAVTSGSRGTCILCDSWTYGLRWLDSRYSVPANWGSDGNSAAAFERLPQLCLVGALVTQTAKPSNRGRESCKSNQDCTIRHSCHCERSGSIKRRWLGIPNQMAGILSNRRWPATIRMRTLRYERTLE